MDEVVVIVTANPAFIVVGSVIVGVIAFIVIFGADWLMGGKE